MANVPGRCPQLMKPTWCTVKDEPRCSDAIDVCILVRQAAYSKAGLFLGGLALLEERLQAEAYAEQLEAWIDEASEQPLDLGNIPVPPSVSALR